MYAHKPLIWPPAAAAAVFETFFKLVLSVCDCVPLSCLLVCFVSPCVYLARAPSCFACCRTLFCDGGGVRFEAVQSLVRSVRNAKAEYKVEPGKKIPAVVQVTSTSNELPPHEKSCTNYVTDEILENFRGARNWRAVLR